MCCWKLQRMASYLDQEFTKPEQRLPPPPSQCCQHSPLRPVARRTEWCTRRGIPLRLKTRASTATACKERPCAPFPPAWATWTTTRSTASPPSHHHPASAAQRNTNAVCKSNEFIQSPIYVSFHCTIKIEFHVLHSWQGLNKSTAKNWPKMGTLIGAVLLFKT